MKANETKKPNESTNNASRAGDRSTQNQSNTHKIIDSKKNNPEASVMFNSNNANDAFSSRCVEKENKKGKNKHSAGGTNASAGKSVKNEITMYDFDNTLSVKTISPDDWKLAAVAGDELLCNSKPLNFRPSVAGHYGDINNSANERVLSRRSTDSNGNDYFLQEISHFQCNSQAVVSSYLNKKFKSQVPENESMYNDVLKRIIKCLYKNWLNQNMCDTVIATDNGDVLTHQIILAAYSPTLERLFDQNKRPLPQFIQINMTEYPRDTIIDVLNFLYTTNLKVDCKNIASLVAVARQLDLPEIINMCGVYLTKNYDHDNIFLHYSVAANNHLKNSKNYLLKVIAMNFSLLVHHNHFFYIPVNRLTEVLTHESLSGEELDILLAVIKWIDFNRTDRTQYAKQLFSNIRFELVDPEAIANQVEIHDWLFLDKSNKDIISEAYKYHALVGTTENPKNFHRTSKQMLDIQASECANDSNNTNKLWIPQQMQTQLIHKTTNDSNVQKNLDRQLDLNLQLDDHDQVNGNNSQSVDKLNEIYEQQKQIKETQLQLEKIQRQILERNSFPANTSTNKSPVVYNQSNSP